MSTASSTLLGSFLWQRWLPQGIHASLENLLFRDPSATCRLLLGGAFVFSWTLNPRNVSDGIGTKEIAGLVKGTRQLLTDFASAHLSGQVAKVSLSKVTASAADIGVRPPLLHLSQPPENESANGACEELRDSRVLTNMLRNEA